MLTFTGFSERTEGSKRTVLSAWNRSRNSLLWYETRTLRGFQADGV